MNRVIYRLSFLTGVHFGKKDLTETESFFCADTLFSALFLEALKEGGDLSDRLYSRTQEGALLFSDGLPYVGGELYIPKPFLALKRENKEPDAKGKKTMKKMKFLPAGKLDDLLENRLDIENTVREFENFGKKEEKTYVALRGLEEAAPYRVGLFSFMEGSGLYVCVQYETEEDGALFERLLKNLSYSGIGGERSSGYGRFTYQKEKMPDFLEKRFTGEYEHYMALSVCMAGDEELNRVIENASFQLKKRSGFTDSANQGEQGIRKRDFYAFSGGGCFTCRFKGEVFDVSRNHVHPVYRYAKALMIGV